MKKIAAMVAGVVLVLCGAMLLAVPLLAFSLAGLRSFDSLMILHIAMAVAGVVLASLGVREIRRVSRKLA